MDATPVATPAAIPDRRIKGSLLELPLELVEMILSAIPNQKTLCALALTNKALSNLVTSAHLPYRNIRTWATDKESPLWDHLATFPAQTANIRHLFVQPAPAPADYDYHFRKVGPFKGTESSALVAASRMRALESLVWKVAGNWNLIQTLCRSCTNLKTVILYHNVPVSAYAASLKGWMPVSLSISFLRF